MTVMTKTTKGHRSFLLVVYITISLITFGSFSVAAAPPAQDNNNGGCTFTTTLETTVFVGYDITTTTTATTASNPPQRLGSPGGSSSSTTTSATTTNLLRDKISKEDLIILQDEFIHSYQDLVINHHQQQEQEKCQPTIESVTLTNEISNNPDDPTTTTTIRNSGGHHHLEQPLPPWFHYKQMLEWKVQFKIPIATSTTAKQEQQYLFKDNDNDDDEISISSEAFKFAYSQRLQERRLTVGIVGVNQVLEVKTFDECAASTSTNARDIDEFEAVVIVQVNQDYTYLVTTSDSSTSPTTSSSPSTAPSTAPSTTSSTTTTTAAPNQSPSTAQLYQEIQIWKQMMETTYNSLLFYTCDDPNFRTITRVHVEEMFIPETTQDDDHQEKKKKLLEFAIQLECYDATTNNDHTRCKDLKEAIFSTIPYTTNSTNTSTATANTATTPRTAAAGGADKRCGFMTLVEVETTYILAVTTTTTTTTTTKLSEELLDFVVDDEELTFAFLSAYSALPADACSPVIDTVSVLNKKKINKNKNNDNDAVSSTAASAASRASGTSNFEIEFLVKSRQPIGRREEGLINLSTSGDIFIAEFNGFFGGPGGGSSSTSIIATDITTTTTDYIPSPTVSSEISGGIVLPPGWRPPTWEDLQGPLQRQGGIGITGGSGGGGGGTCYCAASASYDNNNGKQQLQLQPPRAPTQEQFLVALNQTLQGIHEDGFFRQYSEIQSVLQVEELDCGDEEVVSLETNVLIQLQEPMTVTWPEVENNNNNTEDVLTVKDFIDGFEIVYNQLSLVLCDTPFFRRIVNATLASEEEATPSSPQAFPHPPVPTSRDTTQLVLSIQAECTGCTDKDIEQQPWLFSNNTRDEGEDEEEDWDLSMLPEVAVLTCACPHNQKQQGRAPTIGEVAAALNNRLLLVQRERRLQRYEAAVAAAAAKANTTNSTTNATTAPPHPESFDDANDPIVSWVQQVDEYECRAPQEHRISYTNVIVNFTGGDPQQLSRDEKDVLESSFQQTYNDMTFSECDGKFRQVANVQLMILPKKQQGSDDSSTGNRRFLLNGTDTESDYINGTAATTNETYTNFTVDLTFNVTANTTGFESNVTSLPSFDEQLQELETTSVFRVGVECRRCPSNEEADTFGLFDSFERRRELQEKDTKSLLSYQNLNFGHMSGVMPALPATDQTCYCPAGTLPTGSFATSEADFLKVFRTRIEKLADEKLVESIESIVTIEEDQNFCFNEFIDAEEIVRIDLEEYNDYRNLTLYSDRAIAEAFRWAANSVRDSDCAPLVQSIKEVHKVPIETAHTRTSTKRHGSDSDPSTELILNSDVSVLSDSSQEGLQNFIDGHFGEFVPNFWAALVSSTEPTSTVYKSVTIEMSSSSVTEPDSTVYKSVTIDMPSETPSETPSRGPTAKPTKLPSKRPSPTPTRAPSSSPADGPSDRPSNLPSMFSSGPSQSNAPTGGPGATPSTIPSEQPTSSAIPSLTPSVLPSSAPSEQHSDTPSSTLSAGPSVQPTPAPSKAPTTRPSTAPSEGPSDSPSSTPSRTPKGKPSSTPSATPSLKPSDQPSKTPSKDPSNTPSEAPSAEHSDQPSSIPSSGPSSSPSIEPSGAPSAEPSTAPTKEATQEPTLLPTPKPTQEPTIQPTPKPSQEPTTSPTSSPSAVPSATPSTIPTNQPSQSPSSSPSKDPSSSPSGSPVSPSTLPSQQPSGDPSVIPSSVPTPSPTLDPTQSPTPGACHTCDCFTCGSVVDNNDGTIDISIEHCKDGKISWICCTAVDGVRGECDVTSCADFKCNGMVSGEFTIRIPSDSTSFEINTHDAKTAGNSGNIAEYCGGPPDGTGQRGSCEPDPAHCLITFDVKDDCGYSMPSSEPTLTPTASPSSSPTSQPSSAPSRSPSETESGQPTNKPSKAPSGSPSHMPSSRPSSSPSAGPTGEPSGSPSQTPTEHPTPRPNPRPTPEPTAGPSPAPSSVPSAAPSKTASGSPTAQPSVQPSARPTSLHSSAPSISQSPSRSPSQSPTGEPSSTPSQEPSVEPSQRPSSLPSTAPSKSQSPSGSPTQCPSTAPSDIPSQGPSMEPSQKPSLLPSSAPSISPSGSPSQSPTGVPSTTPSREPSAIPSANPSALHSDSPSLSASPSELPSTSPSENPSDLPSASPSMEPSLLPSSSPSGLPSTSPSENPSDLPSTSPSDLPSLHPSISPSDVPSTHPSDVPSQLPSSSPSMVPSQEPSTSPSGSPSRQPSQSPSSQPSTAPSGSPSKQPSTAPSDSPSDHPSTAPSRSPSKQPSDQPSDAPSGSACCFTGFKLLNADTNSFIRNMAETGEKIKLDEHPENLNIEAVYDGPEPDGVDFWWDGDLERTECCEPYCIGSDSGGGDIYSFHPLKAPTVPTNVEVEVKAFFEDGDGNKSYGPAKSIRFTIIPA